MNRMRMPVREKGGRTRGLVLSCWIALVCLLPVAGRSALKPDETVTLFPALGWASGDGWELDLRGIIFEAGEFPRQADAIGRLLGIDVDQLNAVERQILSRRASAFLVDHERGKDLVMEFAGAPVRFEKSAVNGHFETRHRLSAAQARSSGLLEGVRPVTAQIQTSAGTTREVEILVQLLQTNGWSVISDIDDTIKVSHVLDKPTMLRATFCQPFQAVPGMAAAYQHWAAAGAQFHYLSGSPWQLYVPLSEFMRSNAFPAGSFHLKHLRLKDTSVLGMFGSQLRYKSDAIAHLIQRMPGRSLVFVGDSGEQDPEIYGNIARRHGSRVAHIFIRNVTGEDRAAPRYQTAFRGMETNRWTIFGPNGAAILTNTANLPGRARHP
jgi:hypothetical protein